jgi:hypothetical protein
MRVRVALCLFALLGSLAACGDDRSTATGGPDLTATLTAQPAVTAERITWTYTLRNDEASAIAVFNGAWGDDPPEAGPVSWVVAGPDDTIEVSQRVFAPPPGVGLARDYMQYGTVLQPGATLTGTAMASRPFRVNHPYKSIFDPPLELPEDPSKVILCVGIARAADVPGEPVPTPTATALPGSSPAPAGPLTYYRHNQSTVDNEHLVCAPPLELT